MPYLEPGKSRPARTAATPSTIKPPTAASMKLTDIDPALEHLGRFAKITRGAPGCTKRMREAAIHADGRFSAKVKVLAAMLWSISARCEPCVRYYAYQAREQGATEEEVGEFLALAIALGGCVGEMWAVKAYAAFAEDHDDEPCCEGPGRA